ncbi:hypothetical protein BGZ61DRAFT_547167, partial [Ilyonectria robusta]|uniref:uncharacterized protein n=1 Tax=Ilyonectria robusta TaxID=1079257 RepID=UPI001E8CE619
SGAPRAPPLKGAPLLCQWPAHLPAALRSASALLHSVVLCCAVRCGAQCAVQRVPAIPPLPARSGASASASALCPVPSALRSSRLLRWHECPDRATFETKTQYVPKSVVAPPRNTSPSDSLSHPSLPLSLSLPRSFLPRSLLSSAVSPPPPPHPKKCPPKVPGHSPPPDFPPLPPLYSSTSPPRLYFPPSLPPSIRQPNFATIPPLTTYPTPNSPPTHRYTLSLRPCTKSLCPHHNPSSQLSMTSKQLSPMTINTIKSTADTL